MTVSQYRFVIQLCLGDMWYVPDFGSIVIVHEIASCYLDNDDNKSPFGYNCNSPTL